VSEKHTWSCHNQWAASDINNISRCWNFDRLQFHSFVSPSVTTNTRQYTKQEITQYGPQRIEEIAPTVVAQWLAPCLPEAQELQSKGAQFSSVALKKYQRCAAASGGKD
jgi:ferredoxin-thioredoxin reductase catalytic subunit